MDLSSITEILRSGIIVSIKIASPILIISMLAGIVISIFQAATQINEQTLSFVPKLIIIVLLLVVLGPWMGSVMSDYLAQILNMIGT